MCFRALTFAALVLTFDFRHCPGTCVGDACMCILPNARTGALTSTRTRALTRKHTRKYTHTHTARLFQEAADKGDDWGLNNLGSMLLNGQGGLCVCMRACVCVCVCVCVFVHVSPSQSCTAK